MAKKEADRTAPEIPPVSAWSAALFKLVPYVGWAIVIVAIDLGLAVLGYAAVAFAGRATSVSVSVAATCSVALAGGAAVAALIRSKADRAKMNGLRDDVVRLRERNALLEKQAIERKAARGPGRKDQ